MYIHIPISCWINNQTNKYTCIHIYCTYIHMYVYIYMYIHMYIYIYMGMYQYISRPIIAIFWKINVHKPAISGNHPGTRILTSIASRNGPSYSGPIDVAAPAPASCSSVGMDPMDRHSSMVTMLWCHHVSSPWSPWSPRDYIYIYIL